jgi:2-C-methyl-D-erythritol 4-phosphate cytidylyltransferase
VPTPVVAVLLASPVDAVVIDGRSLLDRARDAVAEFPVVGPDQVPDDAVLVVADPACAGVTGDFVRSLVDACAATGRPQVAVLPVTDTIKETHGPTVRATLDRDGLLVIASPIVLPPGVRARCVDAAGLVDAVRTRHGVDLVPAPTGVLRLTEGADAALYRPPE